MASLHRQAKSPYWYIRLKGENGEWESTSTHLRVDDARATKQARARCAATTAKELTESAQQPSEQWTEWVPGYLRTHCGHETTYAQYMRSWHWLNSFLVEKRIASPRELKVAHVYQYIEWRRAQGKMKSTALVEVKVLRILMQYAFRNDWIQGNPCQRLGIKRDPVKRKKEFSDEDIKSIYKGLAKRPRWMTECFTIALHTGCRISETQISFENIDFKRNTITFINPKGGEAKAFSVPMPTQLRAILTAKKATGAKFTVELPPAYGQHFSKFFIHKLKRPDLTFHGSRVTKITRLLRAGVEERTAMLLVGHSTAEVSRIYQRLRVEDAQYAADKVTYPLPVSVSRRGTRKA